ncbi:TniQ family protein (plasmid) [Rhodococcus sp. DMF-1]|uniref:TniQ family protein n=1 Tax=Rhodococcus sp. DMF-1 TaxID=2907624 RepID=UPI001F1AC311|nr:TniQ family protein [Rhodococcus sp. DMF-1]UIR39672.1 TniQ family protein [Rhodococcus sp. DMF-1]
MTLWQQPAHLLPVRVRPIGGETVVSYVFRLAAANALARPTTLLRALGDPLGVRPTATMVHNSEVTLNAPALARLETFTGLPAAWLCHALPGLSASRGDRLPHTDPTLRAFRSAAIRDHCHCCIARIPGRPQVRVRGHEAPSICRRHRRWVGTTGDHPDQIDLSGNAEILTADRRPPTRRLCSTVEDLAWVREQLWHANRIVTNWHRTRARFPTDTFANLHTRWDRRAATLPRSASATSLLVMPEAVRSPRSSATSNGDAMSPWPTTTML